MKRKFLKIGLTAGIVIAVVATTLTAVLAGSFALPVSATAVDDYVYFDGVRYAPGDEVVELRDQYSKTHYIGEDQYSARMYLGSIHYEESPDSFQPIDTTIVPSDMPTWDWEVLTGHWKLLIANNTTVGVCKGSNWIATKLHGIAYYDASTKDYKIIQTTYDRTPVVDGNTITWENILYGVDFVLRYTNDSLKEEIVVKQSLRDILNQPEYRPSAYGLSNATTYLAPIFECDWSLTLPMKLEGGVSVSPDDGDTDGAIHFESTIEDPYWKTKLVSFLPVYKAISVNPINPEDPEKDWEYAECVMKKRLVKKNDKHWLLTGVLVTTLNQMPEGPIIFDPTETLRPDAGGDETTLHYFDGSEHNPDVLHNFEQVDEVVADDSSTFVRNLTDPTSYLRDLYNLPASSGSGTINKTTVHFRCFLGGPILNGEEGYAKASIKSNSTVTDGAEKTFGKSWQDFTQEWAVNPADSEAWEWSDIDALQIGISLSSNAGTQEPRCTQVYVEVDYTIPAPDPPTDVVATDGTHADKVVVTWTKSDGATKYEVFRDDVGLGELGDVATYNDTGADAPTITAGSAVATDGVHTDKVSLSLSGTSANNGTTHTYKVKAGNATGWSGYSNSDTGYRGPGALTYQWQKSSGDADSDYSNIDGATSSTYDDTNAPAGTVTPGTASASDGTVEAYVVLSLAGESTSDGAGRYYQCVLTATGATGQTSGSNRGYRTTGAITYQWLRSPGDSDGSWLGSWLGTWDKRLQLTVDSSDIDSTLTNFPILVYLSTSSGRTSNDVSCVFDELTADANRKKIAIATSDGTTQCYVEIEEWNDTGEEAWLWVKVPSVASGTDTELYLYYDVDQADNTSYVGDTNSTPAENVWDANFKAVYHMKDGVDNAHIYDSTDNNNDGTKGAAGEPNEVDGQVSKAQEFDGTEKIDVAHHASLNFGIGDFTVMTLAKATSTGDCIVDKGGYSTGFYINTSKPYRTKLDDGVDHCCRRGLIDIEDSAYHMVTMVVTGRTSIDNYTDGVLDNGAYSGTLADVGSIDNAGVLRIGQGSVGNDPFTGDIDEVRASNIIRTAAWIKATKESLWDDLLAFGSEGSNDFTNIAGGTTDPYNDTGAPADGSGRYYYCGVSAAGAATQDSTHDRGYRANPPDLTTDGCTGFSKLWAIVNATIDDEGLAIVTEIGFDYGLDTGYGSSSTETGTWNTSDAYSLKLTSLSPATVYHYRVKAKNNGVWGYGLDRVFSTKGSPVLYEYLNTGGDADGDDIYGNNWAAHQFTTGSISHTTTSFRLYLKRVGSPGDVTVSLKYADAAHKPTGADLCSTTLDGNAFAEVMTWYEFSLTEAEMESAQEFAVVVRALDGGAADYVEWRWDSGGGLADAIASRSTDGGISWTVNAGGADYLFEVWGNPVATVEGAQVFSGYIETGDWLIALTYDNKYVPYYPNEIAASYFYLQLLDGAVVKAQTSCPAWGYRPGSIYLAKSLADTLEWGATDYTVRLYGDFGTNPYSDYELETTDWRGTDLDLLDDWVIAQAKDIGDNIGVTMVVAVADVGEVLNSYGHAMFSIGLPELNVVRPGLFELVGRQPEYTEEDYTHDLQGETDWEVRLGPQVAKVLTDGGDLIGQDGDFMGGVIVFVVFIVIVGLLSLTGNVAIGLILGYPILLTGAWFGLISWVIIGVLTFFAACIFVYKIWLIK